jgi:hypothetical protein
MQNPGKLAATEQKDLKDLDLKLRDEFKSKIRFWLFCGCSWSSPAILILSCF